jgi:LPXTG-motif cell wall-anchored protein
VKLRRTTRRVISALAAVAAGIVGVLVVANPASAHHPVVSGIAVCQPDGTYTVTWTVKNSETDIWGRIVRAQQNGGNVSFGDIKVPAQTDSSKSGYWNLPPAGSVSGVQTGVAGNTTSLSLTVKAKWYRSRTGWIEAERTGQATGWSSNCTPHAPKPDAQLASNCTDVVVTLLNSGNASAEFTVTDEAGSQTTTVDASGQKTVTVTKANADAASDAVKVLFNGQVIAQGGWTDPQTCAVPVVELASDCTKFTVTVSNPSNGPATLDGSFKPAGGSPVAFSLAKGANTSQTYTTDGLAVVVDFNDGKYQDESKTWIKDQVACAPPASTAPPTSTQPALPNTGTSGLPGIIAAGVALVLAGAGLLTLVYLRRRRTAA